MTFYRLNYVNINSTFLESLQLRDLKIQYLPHLSIWETKGNSKVTGQHCTCFDFFVVQYKMRCMKRTVSLAPAKLQIATSLLSWFVKKELIIFCFLLTYIHVSSSVIMLHFAFTIFKVSLHHSTS
jgi:hypothetical protein